MRDAPPGHGWSCGKYTQTVRWLIIAAVLIAPTLGFADEETGQCWDCLQRLALEFPEKNRHEDPSFKDGLSPNSVVGSFARCSLDDSEIPTLQRIIGVFTDARFEKDRVGYVREHLKAIPDLTDGERAGLAGGAWLDLSTTLGVITNRNCRILFQSQFDAGASREWLLQVVKAGRAMRTTP